MNLLAKVGCLRCWMPNISVGILCTRSVNQSSSNTVFHCGGNVKRKISTFFTDFFFTPMPLGNYTFTVNLRIQRLKQSNNSTIEWKTCNYQVAYWRHITREMPSNWHLTNIYSLAQLWRETKNVMWTWEM